MNKNKNFVKIGGQAIVGMLAFFLISAGGQVKAQRPSPPTPQVVVKPVSSKIIHDRLTAIGTGQAQASVALTPWSSGKLERFHVGAGDAVKAGAAIAELDADNEQIMVARAQVELDDAHEALDRLTRLRASDTASRVQVINAELALAKAQLNLRDGELALARRTIRAPIDGIVGILPIDAGNFVTTSSLLARIDNRDKILIDIWLPERFAPQITVGQKIEARAIARGGEIFHGHIRAIDNALDEASRTLRVRAEIVNEGDRLRAGMSFAVTFSFAGERLAAVDPLAIQWRSEGAYVWLVDEMYHATRLPVMIVQRSSDYVLVAGDIRPGQWVVTQGVHNVREGIMVTIRNLSDLEIPIIEGETVSSITQP